MFALFEEAGKLLTGRILSSTEASAHIELDSGRRAKVKLAHVLLTFTQPAPTELMAQAQALAGDIDLDLAWACAPDADFAFDELARDYFGSDASLAQQAAALLRLHDAPHYFRRVGKGRFRKAPAEVLRQALAAIERRRAIEAQIAAWADQLAQGQCPAPVREQLYRILFKPDKNAPEYKAVVHAARATHLAPLALLQRAGAISSAYQFHWQRFLFEYFPRGTGFPAVTAPPVPADLPLAADVAAFSIDDSSTTEIDDALSVQGLGSGIVTVGIHIAAPGLAIAPDSALDRIARERLSTVYVPGHKITMLPDAVVQSYTLLAGAPRPALSLYVRIDEASLQVLDSQTRLEQVPIAHNLRHDQIDHVVTAAWLDAPDAPTPEAAPPELRALHPQLAFLWRLAQACKAQREAVRGRPETFTRPDFTFKLEGMNGDAPTGEETVVIGTRTRGAPLDLIVAEAMILANHTWGRWLAELGVPAIYRSQASLAPGVKVRMGTKALPHAGIGVSCYAWSTSPLRRYTDLVNQWQIIACARHGAAAALAAPFKPRDAALLAIISAFDAAYSAYNQFQGTMERYWTLRYLRQQDITELEAAYLKDNLVRAETLPLVFSVLGTEGLRRGERVRVRLGAIDEVSLEVTGTVVERLGATEPVAETDETLEGESEAPLAAPLTVAVALDDGDEGASDDAGAPSAAAT
ncbi:ribonuclease catalytic domain-containing protein [Tepidimonas charontis]|uniref:ribonuclease catalytic domain-containing protein n=1 Tax=Tepidimonas charontis TaxID=2267262 RepID=UPI001184E24A|nr:ribonuclease catalytic domain-containing protein [Tepidimonas charontis]